jgi:hypothetical protein
VAATLRGDVGGLARAGAIVTGVSVTSMGYALGLLSSRRAASPV